MVALVDAKLHFLEHMLIFLFLGGIGQWNIVFPHRLAFLIRPKLNPSES